MTESILLKLAGAIGAGIGAQWLAWRLRLPSILLLLLVGCLAGPVLGLLDPDAIMGDALAPFVSLSVALILFEGGLTLRFSELKDGGRFMWQLVSIGAAVTWAVATLAGWYFLELPFQIALLLGSILVVTGPTVIGPLLRHVRPTAQVANVLKWEGIIIDPIGAILAVLVFEVVLHGHGAGGISQIVIFGVLKTLLVGILLGGLGALVLLTLLRRYWIPDFLQSPATLAVVVVSFAISNELQHESGLLTVTLLGIIMANQHLVMVHHVLEFKENLRVLLISMLFIFLAARLDPAYLGQLNLASILFVLALVVIARPAAVFLSGLGTGVPLREQAFVAWVAPRGIVAAAISSIFAEGMVAAGHPDAEYMVPVTFLVIASSVLIYGLSAAPVARMLEVAMPQGRGALIAGAHPFARRIATVLAEEGVPSVLIDRSWPNVTAARQEGLNAKFADVLDEELLEDTDVNQMRAFLAMTPNNQVNSLAALHFTEAFERKNVYQLATAGEASPQPRGADIPRHLKGRTLFQSDATLDAINHRVNEGYLIKATPLGESFNFDQYLKRYGEHALPLFALKEDGTELIFNTEEHHRPGPGAKIIGLVPPEPATE